MTLGTDFSLSKLCFFLFVAFLLANSTLVVSNLLLSSSTMNGISSFSFRLVYTTCRRISRRGFMLQALLVMLSTNLLNVQCQARALLRNRVSFHIS